MDKKKQRILINKLKEVTINVDETTTTESIQGTTKIKGSVHDLYKEHESLQKKLRKAHGGTGE